MPTYKIELSDVEQRAFEYVATDVDFWIQNAVHERARLAMEEMVTNYINKQIAAGKTISGTKEQIVMHCGLPDAKTRNAEVIKQAMEAK